MQLYSPRLQFQNILMSGENTFVAITQDRFKFEIINESQFILWLITIYRKFYKPMICTAKYNM